MFFTISVVNLSERENKEIPVVKEEERNNAEVLEEVEADAAKLLKEPQSLVVLNKFP